MQRDRNYGSPILAKFDSPHSEVYIYPKKDLEYRKLAWQGGRTGQSFGGHPPGTLRIPAKNTYIRRILHRAQCADSKLLSACRRAASSSWGNFAPNPDDACSLTLCADP